MSVIDPLIHEPCIWCGQISGDHTDTCRETTGLFPVSEMPNGLICCHCNQPVDDDGMYVRHPRPTPQGEDPECELVCVACALDLAA